MSCGEAGNITPVVWEKVGDGVNGSANHRFALPQTLKRQGTMFINLYHADYEHKEYERRIQAHLIERALFKAREERSKTMITPVGQWFHLAVNLVTTWRWRRSMVQRMG